MTDGGPSSADLSRIRKEVKRCLKPLHDQRNDFIGCSLATVPVIITFLVAREMAFSTWASGGITFIALILFGAIWGNRDERAKAKAADLALDLFDEHYPHDSPQRMIAIDLLKGMATRKEYSHNKDADRLLQELGIEALPEQSADAAISEALDKEGSDDDQEGSGSDPAATSATSATSAKSAPPPSPVKESTRPMPESAQRQPTPTRQARRRHIPLEPEEQDR